MSPSPRPPENWQQLAEEASREQPQLARRHVFGRPQQRRPWWMGTGLLVLWAITLWAWFSSWNPWPPGPSQQQLLEGQEAALLLAAEAIRGYARGHQGHYPTDLSQVLSLNLVIEYRLTDRGFELQARGVGNTPMVLRSQ